MYVSYEVMIAILFIITIAIVKAHRMGIEEGNEDNIKVTGLDDKGNIIIDKNSAVGILEEFKKKHPDTNVTATFFPGCDINNPPAAKKAIPTNDIVNNPSCIPEKATTLIIIAI